ncbi:acetolactate synthase large subunit [Neobacillus sp. 114]|uniref:acetolactate synthase large subunit n=1 Tax=Neobacillus sp. 114 TaxID=3048535 RepID=UPI0024C2B8DA|nr:acetolactate synthase large subunit [Neobacillus sp. 114]
MIDLKVTDVLVQCLENEGVEYIFGIVGKETLDFAESLSKSEQIEFVNVRHEQGAAFMADVYGRLSNKPGVCTSTLGPGAANLITGIASAQLDHSPVVAIIGQAGLNRQHPESHQFVDIVKLFKPVTKWCTQILESQFLPTAIRKAFRTAKLEKPGSIVVTLPENLAAQMIPNLPLSVAPIPEIIPDMDSVKSAVRLIENHLKPFVIVGNGVIRQDAGDALLSFIEALDAPVTHSFMAKGVLPKDHPQQYFTFGFNEQDEVLAGLEEADSLIVIGFDFVEKLPKEWNPKKLPVIHIDTVPAEINEYYPVQAELVGNIKKTLEMLVQQKLPHKTWAPSGGLQEKIKMAYKTEQTDSNLTIENILHIVEKCSNENAIVISDVGAHKVAIARTYQPKKPNRTIISNGLASMGIAIPGSIGAKLACPSDQVICITGDGGALMNISEIETAKRLGLSFIIIVLNDSMLKLEVQIMNKMFGENYGLTFGNPDFVQLADSFGIKGFRGETLSYFEKVFKEALASEEIVLIDVSI